ncbi:MAG: hypothetical protein HC836_26175 [Richelia sp. RM2_1_2]|nr:hypothetical protein [Richelia sp. RM2_1_2]
MVKQRTKNQKVDISNDKDLANPNYLPGKSPPVYSPTGEQTRGTQLVGLKPFPTQSTEAASKWYVDNFAAGAGGISTVEDDGVAVASNASIINFGANLSVTNNGSGRVTIDSSVGTTPLEGRTFLPSTYDTAIFTKTSTSATTVGTPVTVDSDTVSLTVAGVVPPEATHVQIRAQLIGVAQGNNNILLMIGNTLANAIAETNPKLTLKLTKETGENWGSVSDLTWVDDDYVTFVTEFDTVSDIFGYKIVDNRNDTNSLGLSDSVTVTFYIEGYWLSEIATILSTTSIQEDLIGAVNSTLIVDGIETSSSAINHLRIRNATTGQPVIIESFSPSDVNVNLEIRTKGSGLLVGETGYDMSTGPSLAFATKGYVDGIAVTGSKYIKINSTGTDASATGTDAIAIGEGASATQTNSVAIGPAVANSTANTVRIGSSNTNYLSLSNGADLTLYDGTGSSSTSISANGTGTNIDLTLVPKGTGTIAASSKRITSVANPTSAQDAATKSYVDGLLGGGSDGAVIGEIKMYGGSSPPPKYLTCNGSAISRTTYAALFAVIGTAFGVGNGTTTFNIPNMLGRVPVGAGAGSGLTNRILGALAGAETHILTTNQMPSHSHSASSVVAGAHTHTGTAANAGAHTHTGTAANAGAHTHTGSGSTTDSAGAHTHNITDNFMGAGNNFLLPTGSEHGIVGNVEATTSAGAHSHTISSLTIASAGDHAHALTIASAVDHSHAVTIASAGDHSHAITVLSAGSDQPHNIMQPYTVINYIIYAGV